MKRFLTTVVMVASVLFVAQGAAAFTWTYYDFGVDYFDEHNNTTDVAGGYPHGVGNRPSPGTHSNNYDGGESFDDEGLNFAEDGGNFYISLTNSYGASQYSTYFNDFYASGHLFFGFDGADDQFAIDMMTGDLYSVGGTLGIPNKPGTYYGTPIEALIGPWRVDVAASTLLGNVATMMTQTGPGFEPNPLQPPANDGDTWITEICFDKTLLSVPDWNSISFRHTIECGNDLLLKSYQGAIPEPATLILLGTGLLGVAYIRRRRSS